MLFAKKSKGYFVDYSDNGCLIARTSASSGPMVIEQVTEVPAGDEATLQEALSQIETKKNPSGYVHATVGVYPDQRFVRRATLEVKRLKEPTYLNEMVSTQLRVEPDKNAIALLNANDGTDYDVGKGSQKEVLCCGLPNNAVVELQDRLLSWGIYPERLELGSVAALGAIVSMLAVQQSDVPTLVLEIGGNSTHSFIVSRQGVDASRPIPQGLDSMIPVVQKELNLKDEESARKLFYSNTFDFAGMGPLLIKKLFKELQSSIGFYEVQTGQSIGQIVCLLLPPKLGWLEAVIATQLGVAPMKYDFAAWLQSQGITPPDESAGVTFDNRWLGILGLMANHHASVSQKE